MKAFYIILFFTDIVVMVSLAFLFLRLVDFNAPGLPILTTGAGILVTIALLFFLLSRYIKSPARKAR